MQINTQVELDADDSFAYTPEAAAQQVLAALGGNPTTDYSVVSIHMDQGIGNAGTPPAQGPAALAAGEQP